MKNIFDFNELNDFFDKISNYSTNYIIEYKIDGLSIILEYLNGILIKALTRGNGIFGEDVTNNIYKIKSIPKKISFNKRLVVRGEIFITKKNFEIINKYRLKKNLELFSNPRNTASGALRNIDMPDYFHLSALFFNIENIDDFNFHTDDQCLDFLKKLNFTITNFNIYNNILIESNISKMFDDKNKLDYNIDGIVIKINNLQVRKLLGETSKFPRWAIAFKNKTNIVETKILDVINSVGRFGTIFPVAILEPVLIDGTIIKKVTLHNYLYIQQNDIRINDVVKICKSGEIIPKIISVNLELRNNTIKISIPKYCPDCNSILKIDNQKKIICKNKNCLKQLERSICHYISEDGMNIKFLGKETIRILINEKILLNIDDLYNLNLNQLCSINGINETKAKKILLNIQLSKQNYLKNFIYALGINNVGKQIAFKLAIYYKILNNFLNTNIEELMSIDDLGHKTSENIILFLNNNKKIIEKLSTYLILKNENIIYKETFLLDKNIVLTGKFNNFNRKNLTDILINKYGAHILKNISKKTDILITGSDPGSKLKKAILNNIRIINEEDINKILMRFGG